MDEPSLAGEAERMCDHLWGAPKHYSEPVPMCSATWCSISARFRKAGSVQGELHACLLPVSGFESVVQPSHPSVRSEQELCEADHTVRSFEGGAQDSNKNYVQVPWTTAQCQVPLLPA